MAVNLNPYLMRSPVFNQPLFKKLQLHHDIAVTLYLPYMTLQMIQVGLNIEEIAIIYSVLPFVGAIMPPIAGRYIVFSIYQSETIKVEIMITKVEVFLKVQ